jgi:hypothetical protein
MKRTACSSVAAVEMGSSLKRWPKEARMSGLGNYSRGQEYLQEKSDF